MKKIVMLAAVTAMLGACNTATKTYTLTGTVDSLFNGTTAYLVCGEQEDSTVVENGAFAFSGQIDTPKLARVVMMNAEARKRTGAQVVLEPGTLVVTLGEETTVAGTPLNDALNTYTQKVSSLYKELRETYMSLRDNAEMKDEEKENLLDEAQEKYTEASGKLHRELYAANTNTPLGAIALLNIVSSLNPDEEKAQFDSLYAQAGDVVRSNPNVAKAKTRYENLEKTSVGKMFTDFTIETGAADGTAVSLSDYVGKGKYVLVDFWASWCGPCRAEMPNLAEVYKKYKGNRFEIVGVAVWDERNATEKALESLPITWPVIFDAQQVPTDLYGINGIPQIILFGPDGVIVARDLRGEKIGEKVAECLGK